ncbi:lysoplasmalogenase [Paenibacillus albiflavus]|uniref:Lysoplasmalogenase n=1 Tax=Paenibacillus albiflavus TaxID=2545760 RepID=A0A4R4EFU0_9BACL|nr:lysoplasmalogenase [Paenibacillus albiflavus]TCZ77101.1 lysoplasmalogenase [Paenibacillus albiflavus]
MVKRLLAVLILVMGLVDIFVSSAMLFKLIPMWLILIYAYLHKPHLKDRYFLIVLTGLFFCMLGDGLLKWFVVGLSAFLIGHLFYTWAFITRWRFSWIRFSTILPLLLYGIYMGYRIFHSLQDKGDQVLIIPVLVYLLVISLMCWFSIMTGNKWSIVGGILFVTSDSILAWNMFITDIAYSHVLIMSTYYMAQFLIARSIGTTTQSNSAKLNSIVP